MERYHGTSQCQIFDQKPRLIWRLETLRSDSFDVERAPFTKKPQDKRVSVRKPRRNQIGSRLLGETNADDVRNATPDWNLRSDKAHPVRAIGAQIAVDQGVL